MFYNIIKNFSFKAAGHQGYILPLLDYGSITWGATSDANLERLEKLQKRAARIILHADFTSSSSLMFEELGWLSVFVRLRYNKAIMTYKALNNQTPEYISDLLKPMSEVHALRLSSSENGSLFVLQDQNHSCVMAHFLVLYLDCGTLFLKLSNMLNL